MRRQFSGRTHADLMQPFAVGSAEERWQAEQFYLDLVGRTSPRSGRELERRRAEQFYLDLMGWMPPRSERESVLAEDINGSQQTTPPPMTPDEKRAWLKGKLDAPLTASEMAQIRESLKHGMLWSTLADRQTFDADENAILIASGIAGSRVGEEEPFFHVAPRMAEVDPRLANLLANVRALGQEGLVDPVGFSEDARTLHAMRTLVGCGYSPAGAAGLVGNMRTESALFTNMVEGGQRGDESKGIAPRPMRALDVNKKYKDFTSQELLEGKDRTFDKSGGSRVGGIGIVQWTFTRRDGLFKFNYRGKVLGKDILFNLDAQLAFVVFELREGLFKKSGLDDVLKTATDSTVAAGLVMDKYERPQPGTQSAREKSAFRALQLYEKYYPPKQKKKN